MACVYGYPYKENESMATIPMALSARSMKRGTLFVDLYEHDMERREGPSAKPQSSSHVTWYFRVSLQREDPT